MLCKLTHQDHHHTVVHIIAPKENSLYIGDTAPSHDRHVTTYGLQKGKHPREPQL